jgi:hypothetical protein
MARGKCFNVYICQHTGSRYHIDLWHDGKDGKVHYNVHPDAVMSRELDIAQGGGQYWKDRHIAWARRNVIFQDYSTPRRKTAELVTFFPKDLRLQHVKNPKRIEKILNLERCKILQPVVAVDPIAKIPVAARTPGIIIID